LRTPGSSAEKILAISGLRIWVIVSFSDLSQITEKDTRAGNKQSPQLYCAVATLHINRRKNCKAEIYLRILEKITCRAHKQKNPA
jgi:hypothetical protein